MARPGLVGPPEESMTERQDRRTPGVNRVPVARLVDICGRDATVPAFEAESVEVSGRGMHVKTPYLPPLGAPLVCRLEDDGREIVVEGVVAWQSERVDGGEFGVQFTALDSGSVEALKALCGLGPRPEAEKREPVPAPRHEPEAPAAATGSPVKLHIDGLGAPMKARVKGGSPRKLQVGSNLEFLKVGKNLQIEDVEHGEKRGARIDAVSIALDPETQIPQLVVVLRYEGEDRTPEPSVVGGEAAAVADDGENRVASARASSDHNEMFDIDEDAEASAAAMRGPVDQFAASVGKSAMATSQKLAAASGVAAKGLAAFVKAGGARFLASRAAAAAQTKRRSTAPAPQNTLSREPRLRPQNAPAKGEEPVKPRRRLAVVGGASVLVIAGLAFALNSRSKTEPRAQARNAESAALESTASSLATGAQAGAAPPVPSGVAVPGNAVAGMPPQGGQRQGVVANVPLFGATPMATVEPAPLGPLPDEITALSPRSKSPASGESDLEDEDPRSAVQDESFDDGKARKKDDEKSPDAIAEAVKPFGLGKMHLPVVYRIKLDKPGTALEGRSQGSGFTVTIPGRKTEGSSSAITKRDDRISEVKMKNGPTGAVVTFVFRSKVPGYKVRLRKSYLEVFVSSPDSAR